MLSLLQSSILIPFLAILQGWVLLSISATDSATLSQTGNAERYVLSREEVAVYRSQRVPQYGGSNMDVPIPYRNHSIHTKRSAWTKVACMKHDVERGERPDMPDWDEHFYWISASCLAPYKGPYFWVWCLRYGANQNAVHSWSVKRFLGQCEETKYCKDTTSKTNGNFRDYGLFNDIKCMPTAPLNGGDEDDGRWEAIRASGYREITSCTGTKTLPESFSYLPKYRPPAPPRGYKRTRRVYDMQEEVTLADGGDYKAASLYFRDMDVPLHVEYRRAELTNANVTHTEVVIDSYGITERKFQFCTRLHKSKNRSGGPWVVLYHSVEDITDRGPGRGHGEAS